MLHLPTPMLMGAPQGDPYSGADIVLDFAGVRNGGTPFYRRDGVVVASAAAAGFGGNGTFGPTGYTATGTQRRSGSVSFNGDFIIFARFVQPTIGPARILWSTEASNNNTYRRPSPGAYEFNAIPGVGPTSATAMAAGRAGGSYKVSFDGGAPATGNGAPAQLTDTLFIGNHPALGDPFTSAIALVEVHLRTLSDAEIQALAT